MDGIGGYFSLDREASVEGGVKKTTSMSTLYSAHRYHFSNFQTCSENLYTTVYVLEFFHSLNMCHADGYVSPGLVGAFVNEECRPQADLKSCMIQAGSVFTFHINV